MQRDIKTLNLTITPASRFVVFSDADRGDGTGADGYAAQGAARTLTIQREELEK